MSRPTFGDPAAIAKYTKPDDYVYEFWELVEMPECPPDLRMEYYKAGSDIAMIDTPSDPALPKLWKAQEAAERRVRAWAKRQGLRVTPYGMREDEGML